MNAVPDWLAGFARLPEELQRRELKRMPARLRRRLFEEWAWQAHGGQREPAGDWRVWLIMAGRGFGKTRAGAEWVWARARERPDARIALVGATLEEVMKVMIDGESGLRAVARTGEQAVWRSSRDRLEFSSGAIGLPYSGARPEKLRGPQHHYAWCDEIAKWAHADSCWDNLMLGLRLGERPRTMVTTTPRAVPVLRRLLAMPKLAPAGGRTAENVHLPDDYIEAVTGLYGGTRLGRQELDGLLIDEAEGALWPRALIERERVAPLSALDRDWLRRVVVGVDPPAAAGASGGDACGIIVAGLGRDGIGYVLEDCSVAGLSPEGWAARVAAAAERWQADRVIAEGNQGGAMVESVLRAAERSLPLKLAYAREGKVARAEPVATLFERGRAKFAGSFPELEDELAGMASGRGYEGPGRSPDRADAMIWALGELMLAKPRAEPRIRIL